MFKILDGREAFYQWDVEQKIVVEDRSITQVHYCNRTDDCALICECYELDSHWVADVPNILLQDNWRIRVYAYDGCATKHEQRFDVIARSKPDTYVYTETEVLNYENISKRMEAIEGDIEGAVKDYLEENPVEVDLTGYATETYVAEQISKIDIPETDLTGYATEKYVDDAISTIELTPGKDGKDGVDGKDGYTPIKGVDYFDGKDGQPGKDGKDYVLTDADKQEIAGMVEVTGEEVDLTDYYTKTEVDEKIDAIEIPDDALNITSTSITDKELIAEIKAIYTSGVTKPVYIMKRPVIGYYSANDGDIKTLELFTMDAANTLLRWRTQFTDNSSALSFGNYRVTHASQEYVDEAIANIEIPEGSGGTGESIEEVHVGTDAPTVESVKIWVNPDEEVKYATETYVNQAIAAIVNGEEVSY